MISEQNEIVNPLDLIAPIAYISKAKAEMGSTIFTPFSVLAMKRGSRSPEEKKLAKIHRENWVFQCGLQQIMWCKPGKTERRFWAELSAHISGICAEKLKHGTPSFIVQAHFAVFLTTCLQIPPIFRSFCVGPVLRGYTGWISKNLMLYKNVHQTKLTIGKCSSLLILQQQLSHGQNKVKNGNF